MSESKYDRIAGLFLAALFICIPLLFTGYSYNLVYVKDIFFTILSAGLFLVMLFKGRTEINRVAWIPAVMAVWVVVSILFSGHMWAGVPVVFRLFGLFALFLFVNNYKGINIEKIKNIIVISSVPVIFFGVLQAFVPGFTPVLMVFGERITGAFGNPNFFAAYLIAVIPLILFRINAFSGIKKKLLYILLGLSVFCIMMTGSKASLIALAAEVLFVVMYAFYAKGFGLKKIVMVTSAVIVIGVVLLPAFFRVPYKKVLDANEWLKNDSVFFRIYTWKGTIEMIKDNPVFGVGPGAFSVKFPGYRPEEIMEWADKHNYEIMYPENILLQSGAETGIPGLVILLFLIVMVFRSFSGTPHRDFSAALTGILVINMFGVDSNYITTLLPAVFYASYITRESDGRSFVPGDLFKNILIAVIILMGSIIVYFQIKNYISDVYLNRGISFSQGKRWQEAIGDYKRSILFNGNNVVSMYFLGNSYYDSKLPGYRQSALNVYEKLQKKSEDYIQVKYKKARIFAELQRLDESIAEHEKMLLIDPYFKSSLFELAYIYYNGKKDFEKAIYYMNIAREQNPEDPAVYNNLGNLYFSEKNYKKAIESYEKAIELSENRDYYYNLGVLYFSVNDKANATKYLMKAAEMGKNDMKLTSIINVLEKLKDGK